MSLPYQNAVLIYNPIAGRQRHRRIEQLQTAKVELERSGMGIRLQATAGAGQGSTLAREAVQEGADLILVCGGDGTLHEVVNGMAGSSVPLAVLPGGTANGFARELGLPLDIVAAARRIPSATPRRIALGRVGDRYFLSMVGAGFDAQVLTKIEGRWKEQWGMTYYGMEALREAVFAGFTPFTISSDQKRLEATYAVISRTRYYGPFRMIPEADLFSDQFTVYGLPSRRLARYFVYALALFAGRLGHLPDVVSFPARTVRCEESAAEGKNVLYQVDGELAGRLPITVEIVPDALILLVPVQRREGHSRSVQDNPC